MFDCLVESNSNHLLMIPIGLCRTQFGRILVACEIVVSVGFTELGRKGVGIALSSPH
jgi:hypothetical protein